MPGQPSNPALADPNAMVQTTSKFLEGLEYIKDTALENKYDLALELLNFVPMGPIAKSIYRGAKALKASKIFAKILGNERAQKLTESLQTSYKLAEKLPGTHKTKGYDNDKINKIEAKPTLSDKIDFKWIIKDNLDADKISRHPKFGMFYRDPKQTFEGKQVWWSKDKAEHGGSKYKLFKAYKEKLIWFADVDETGRVLPKHKSKTGQIIFKNQLIGVK